MSKKVVLFGAGGSGENYIKNQEKTDDYEIIAVVDSDIKKHGNKLLGKYTILSPEELSTIFFNEIIITSMFVYDITDQLVNELNIPKEKLVYPPKSLLKPYCPFEDIKTREYAIDMLIYLVDLFETNNIRYFIDFGTLLGIVRDGDLIHWDDDIDLSIWPEDKGDAIKILKEGIDEFPSSEIVKWDIKLTKNSNCETRSIKLYFNDPHLSGIREFHVSIFIIRFCERYADRSNNTAPKYHFIKYDYVNFKNVRMKVPYNYKKFLEYHYGNWMQPRKDISFMDIPGYQDVENLYGEEVERE